MNKAQAIRIFVAAHDDPVLAAWTAVIHEHKMAPECDVSPYEYWEAFQAFFSHGLVSPYQYNGLDANRVFFSGKRPVAGDIQRVLDNLRVLPEHHTTEVSMSKSKFPDNPFGSSNAIVTKERENGVATRQPVGLPAQRAAYGLHPFGHNEPSGRGQEPLTLDGFGAKKALHQNESPGPGRHLARSGDVDLKQFCCTLTHDRVMRLFYDVQSGSLVPDRAAQELFSLQLQMDVADMQAEGPDAIPGGQISVIDRVLHGTCPHCEREHHHSVGEVVHHDEHR